MKLFTEATGHADSFTNSRQTSIKKIFFRNLGSLEGNAYDAYPALKPEDAKRIMQSLFASIPTYRRKPDGFLPWARKLVRREAARYEFTETILRDRRCRGAICKGIRKGLSCRFADAIVDVEDVEQEVYSLVFSMAHELAKPSSVANIRTRLCALAENHAYKYHSKKQNRRHELISKYLQMSGELHCEYLTDLEIAAIRAEEFDQMAA